jgi:SAM-dependent methyltransferase
VADKNFAPLAQRSDADAPVYTVLARLGKRVLRPGGVELTARLLAAADIGGADVVELGPGLGRTAQEIVALGPKSYVGIDDSAETSDRVQQSVAAIEGRTVVAEAANTGLESGSADVVIGEAILNMRGENAKKAVVDEAYRILRPGGRYAIHELGLMPDWISSETKDAITRDLARAARVNARPLTVPEWTDLLIGAGFAIRTVDHAPMALLRPGRVVTDEGLRGALRFVGNLVTHPAARKRAMGVRRTFAKYSEFLTAVAIVAVAPQADTVNQ